MMKTINSSLLGLICFALSWFLFVFILSVSFTFFSPPCLLLFPIPLHKHRDWCTGKTFGRRKMMLWWSALIDLGMHRPSVSVPLCKCYFFRNRMLGHRLAPPTSAQMVIKSRSSSLIYQCLHVWSGPEPSALICCPTSEETKQYIIKLFI